jgi:hypothetical protein
MVPMTAPGTGSYTPTGGNDFASPEGRQRVQILAVELRYLDRQETAVVELPETTHRSVPADTMEGEVNQISRPREPEPTNGGKDGAVAG